MTSRLSYILATQERVYMLAVFESAEGLHLHGLWCGEVTRREPFDIGKLHAMLPRLHAVWYDSAHTDEHFWRHEWEKHGVGTLKDYFQRALDLFDAVVGRGTAWVRQFPAASKTYNGAWEREYHIPVERILRT